MRSCIAQILIKLLFCSVQSSGKRHKNINADNYLQSTSSAALSYVLSLFLFAFVYGSDTFEEIVFPPLTLMMYLYFFHKQKALL